MFDSRIGDLIGRQDLDRDRTVEASVAGLVHNPHAAPSDLTNELVMEKPAMHGSEGQSVPSEL